MTGIMKQKDDNCPNVQNCIVKDIVVKDSAEVKIEQDCSKPYHKPPPPPPTPPPEEKDDDKNPGKNTLKNCKVDTLDGFKKCATENKLIFSVVALLCILIVVLIALSGNEEPEYPMYPQNISASNTPKSYNTPKYYNY